MNNKLPIPKNEMQRVFALSDFDIDYTNLENNFKDLTRLAAKVSGTDISLVNLIDSFTQWTVSSHGVMVDQMPREDSVCQYTIAQENDFEVLDLSADERFKDKFYVSGDLKLKYYYGVPLRANGHNVGALCVMDTKKKELSPEKSELLQIIADEIVNRLKTIKKIQDLHYAVAEASESKRRVAHDIRGPLGGIIGLARIMSEQGHENQMDEVLEFVNLIHKSGNSILDLADEILGADKLGAKKEDKLNGFQFNLRMLEDKLIKLYTPQALNKGIDFEVNVTPTNEETPFSKNKLLQIIGNLVSNAMKFTPAGGKVAVDLTLKVALPNNILQISVKDTGVGMNREKVDQILNGEVNSSDGTDGEQGYGFGLALVKHLIVSLSGKMDIISQPGEGTTFELQLPQIVNR